MQPEKPLPPFSAKEREHRKTAEARAEDIAYTINHAIACTVTDFIDPYFGNLTQKFLGRRYSVGCGHDHDHRHAPQSHLKQWMVGEFIGDFGAVPVTVAAQRLAPEAMHSLQHMLEPVLGGYFRAGAERAARAWAEKNNIAADSDACKARADEIYRHEVDHLPQALLWTASSIVLNLASQRALGNRGPLWLLAAGKATGTTISAGMVVGGRGLMPETARNWDQFTSRNLFVPATKALGALAGVDEAAINRMVEKEEKLKAENWAARVKPSGDARQPTLPGQVAR